MFFAFRQLREDASMQSCPQRHLICILYVEREPEIHILTKQQVGLQLVWYISIVTFKSL
jgi:hypothetical protein